MEQHHVAVTHLIEYTHHMSLTKRCSICCLHRRDVRNIAVVTNGIVVDEVTNFLYQTVVTHRYVTQCGVVDARMLGEALGHLDHLFKLTQANIAIKHYAMEIIRTEIVGYTNPAPVLSPTAIALKDVNFFLCQLSVISHKSIIILVQLFFYLIKEVIIRILLHVQFTHTLIEHLAKLINILLLTGRDKQAVTLHLRHPSLFEFVQ